MLVIPLTENDLNRVAEAEALADCIELRLDTLSPNAQLPKFTKPLILTLRTREQGGHFTGSHKEREAIFRSHAHLNPAYIDLELTTPPIDMPGAKVICSYHNFKETPDDLDAIYEGMVAKSQADIYKIATTARSVSDLIRLLAFVKRTDNVSGMCLGEFGHESRVLGPIAGSQITYACLPGSQGTAPGQIDAQTLVETYRFHSLNKETEIYALIGSPVAQSVSHKTHNAALGQRNAVFVKLHVQKEELCDFFRLKRQLPFVGFAITTPHKREIAHLIQELDPNAKEIGAINTLYLDSGVWRGANTDETGAMEAIAEVATLAKKRAVVLGTGGAARAVVYGLRKRGADVVIAGRNREQSASLARELGCRSAPLCALPDYDLLINATSAGMFPDVHHMPIKADQIAGGKIVMDVVSNPKETRLLQEAGKKGCRTISGTKMFIYQAKEQFRLWSLASTSLVEV